MILSTDLYGVLPMFVLACVSLLTLLLDAFNQENVNVSFTVTICGILATLFLTYLQPAQSPVFNGMILVNHSTKFLSLVVLAGAFFSAVLSQHYLKKMNAYCGEYYVLILFATLGMLMLVCAGDLLIIFLGIELMSLSFYVLAGFMRKRSSSNESAIKYFLLGAFATGFLLYGIALLYGASGTTNIDALTSKLDALETSTFFWLGIGLLFVGFAFKIASAPFHMWAPDVYEGAPTSSTGFMASAGKTAAFSGLLVVFAGILSHQSGMFSSQKISTMIAIISAASMILGNVIAIAQTNIKRMLAYSSIAHAGYMLAGLAAGSAYGSNGIMFYLAAYTLMTLGSFGIISLVENTEEKNISLNDYAGLSNKQPALAAMMAIFMFSLSGIPPFAGFFGKYYVFAAAVQGGYMWLAILGVLTSCIAAYYYLRVIVLMYFKDNEAEILVSTSRTSFVALSVVACGVVVFGMFPSLLTTLFQ
jgi:NADH-quinone oxidoreductase subunit N